MVEYLRLPNGMSLGLIEPKERSAGPFFGVRGYGCHVNGLVEVESGLKLWVATRSRLKPTYPGCLDHVVAGFK